MGFITQHKLLIVLIRMHIYAHECMHTHIYTYKHTHTNTHTHTHTHTHKHTHTHTCRHTDICKKSIIRNQGCTRRRLPSQFKNYRTVAIFSENTASKLLYCRSTIGVYRHNTRLLYKLHRQLGL